MTSSLHEMAFMRARESGTPLYLYSETRLDEAVRRFRRFTDSLPLPVETYYSFKTNYLPQLCWQLRSTDIDKCAGLLQQAITEGPPRLINVESDTEIDILCETRIENPTPVGIRVRVPALTGQNGSDPSEGWHRGTLKFGWPTNGNAVIKAVQRLATAPLVELEALHLHLGGQIVSADVYERALSGLCALLERLAEVGIRVSTLDLGGGLASGWVAKRRTGPLAQLASAAGLAVETATQRKPDLPGIAVVFHEYGALLRAYGIQRLVLKPGRFLAEPSMLAVAKVVTLRREDDRNVAILDIGINALHCCRLDETRPIHLDVEGDGEATSYEIVGPLCHRSDTFGTITASGPLSRGNLAIFDAIGAYSLGDWIANAWDRPSVVAVDDGAVLWPRSEPSVMFTGAVSLETVP